MQAYETGLAMKSSMQSISDFNITCSINGMQRVIKKKYFDKMLKTYMDAVIHDCLEEDLDLDDAIET
jgi:hypothetical protein